ncbi:Nonribosomal peptide synthetases (NRPS) [Penicillium angulare]|uniref:Nonribosomal peptide synthetases (NRPS) n=1 Tax=Penicillium angulare TaxID=116970 RepID=UPI002540E1DF|nr:Nonribosomal peptide synthetases (NRPS) [Penicillium angulare]KAJ5279767.1 Nonribosomal peptide synthetases (NRPS) [Penicillium angulare]
MLDPIEVPTRVHDCMKPSVTDTEITKSPCDDASEIPSSDLILQWNTHTPESCERLVHDLISSQCHNYPAALAVHAWDGDLTYLELDQKSNTLAAHLIASGVGPELFVPLYFDKSQWLPVAILAVMKAGGAFLFLPPSYPLPRLQEICHQVGAQIVLTAPHYMDQIEALGCKGIVVDEASIARLAPTQNGVRNSLTVPSNALYAIFSSGSTGKPKTIVIEHRNFCAASKHQQDSFSFDRLSRTLQNSAFAFDVIMVEFLFTMIHGGCLCIPSEKNLKNGLADVIADMQVTHILVTPSVARLLSPSDLLPGTTLCVGGEPTTPEDSRIWTASPHIRFIQGYGPSECTPYSHMLVCKGPALDHRSFGFPIGCRCWVVAPDDYNRLAVVGEVGEMVIEGPIVGRGYLGQPDRTAEVFINPPGWRMQLNLPLASCQLYRTGDLVQYAEDGSLCFVRRRDLQAKVNGQRLELGEVENQAVRYFAETPSLFAEVIHPNSESRRGDILALFVCASISGTDEPILARPTESFRLQAAEAQSGLRNALPAYMVPTVFILLSRVPLTMSGKVDRRQLRKEVECLSTTEINAYRIHSRLPWRPAGSFLEIKLRDIWAEILGLKPNHIGVDDTFLDIGGDSLLAMKMIQAARKQGIQGLKFVSVMRPSTLAQLAQISSETGHTEAGNVPPLQSPWNIEDLNLAGAGPLIHGNIERMFQVTDAQRDLLISEHKTHFNFFLHQAIDMGRLQHACQRLVNRHGSLRSLFVQHQNEYVQIILSQLHVPLHIYQVTSQTLEDFRHSLCQRDADTPLSPGEPYFQATLASAGPDHHLLIIRMNHAQFDATMLPPLFEELGDLYCGKEDLLVPSVSFAHYRDHRAMATNPTTIRFWRKYLEGGTMTAGESLAGGTGLLNREREQLVVFTTFPAPCPPPGITFPTLVKAAWALVVARVTQQTDIVFGHVVDGHSLIVPDADPMSSVAGACFSRVPIRVTFQPHFTPIQLLRHVKDQYARTIDYELMEPRRIVAECTPWPLDTRCGSLITIEPGVSASPSFGGDPCHLKFDWLGYRHDRFQIMDCPIDFMIHPDDSAVRILSAGSTHMLSRTRLEWLTHKLGEAWKELTTQRDMPISLAPYTSDHEH